jgi:hypothetical protein
MRSGRLYCPDLPAAHEPGENVIRPPTRVPKVTTDGMGFHRSVKKEDLETWNWTASCSSPTTGHPFPEFHVGNRNRLFTKRVDLDNQEKRSMKNNDLSVMLIVAVLASFTETTSFAQQTAPQSTPQVKDLPVTTDGKRPPAEVTPNHPLPSTTGVAPRSSERGRADAKPSKDDDRRDREHER